MNQFNFSSLPMLMMMVVVVVAITTTCTLAQTPYVLDRFSVNQATLSLSKPGVVSNYNCGSSSNVAGGIRKVSLTAPSGTNVGFAAQVGVFIPSGATTAPNGITSANNNLQSPSFQVLYRLDADTGICSSGTNVESTSSINKSTKNLNINLAMIGATGFQFSALSGSSATYVSVILYSSTGSVMAQSQSIKVVNTSPTASFNVFTLPFLDSTKWTSSSSFSGTVGAIELMWPLGSDTHFAINLIQFTTSAASSVRAAVYTDCGCDGYQAGSGDIYLSGQVVTLLISGSGSSCSGMQLQTTGNSGSVIFNNLPVGCVYTLSVQSSLGLCSNSPSTQTVAAGGTANFGALDSTGSLMIPPDKTVICGSDTSPATTGTAAVSVGRCGYNSLVTFVDTVTSVPCTAPGGIVSIISRTWNGAGTSKTQTITVVDNRNIVLYNVPASGTIQCNQQLPNPVVTATSCTPTTVVSADSTGYGTCDTSTCSTTSTITRTYTATDQCGNTASRTTTFTRLSCAPLCPPPPPPAIPPPPPPTGDLPSNANCRFICDDADPYY